MSENEQPGPAAFDEVRRALAAVDRDTRTRLLATLARRFGDLDLAEDALQEALAQAVSTWPATGVPQIPEAWLTITATRKALDVIRRENTLAQKLAQLHIETDRAPLASSYADPAETLSDGTTIPDDRLAMIFACAHPVLRAEDRVALMLRFVAGLSVDEVAHALLVPKTTMQQRIVRAKKRVATLGVPFGVPPPDAVPERLAGALRVVYLLYSEGFSRSTGSTHIRDDLTEEAIRLARLLHRLLPGRAEVTGLLALLVLTEARRRARVDDAGAPIPLADQDRSLWDAALIAEGTLLAEAAAAAPDAAGYAIQAAIAAVHAEAGTFDATDWAQIAVHYRLLEAHDDGPVVRLGRAVAVGRAYGPAKGLRLLEGLSGDAALSRYRPYHVALALTRTELGDARRAADDYRRALALPGNAAEDAFLADSLPHDDLCPE